MADKNKQKELLKSGMIKILTDYFCLWCKAQQACGKAVTVVSNVLAVSTCSGEIIDFEKLEKAEESLDDQEKLILANLMILNAAVHNNELCIHCFLKGLMTHITAKSKEEKEKSYTIINTRKN